MIIMQHVFHVCYFKKKNNKKNTHMQKKPYNICSQI